MQFLNVDGFDHWRREARALLAAEVPPCQVSWNSADEQPSLFGDSDTNSDNAAPASDVAAPIVKPTTGTVPAAVPKAFLELSRHVACHRDPGRWELLYRMLWRLTHGEKHLLKLTTDDDVHRIGEMNKAVTRDVHKMKAFVRFRKLVDDRGQENFVAWHRPDHHIVRLAAPFFSRRFKAMNWTILTPHESVVWDQSTLTYGPGVPVSEAPRGDELEDLWRTYYASIFNPARVKLATMKREMPVRHWATLPEADLISELLARAPTRVEQMIEAAEGFRDTAAHFLPDDRSLPSLADAVRRCTACDLHCDATQAVFGRGPDRARVVLVGEQPGDREDLAGEPFVGPAGQLLDQALVRAGIDRDQVYVTNVVKHFKFVQRGPRRLHKKPDSREIFACRPWLEAELAAIQPAAIVCLGATAAQALFGRDFRITQQRGQSLTTDWSPRTLATWHPAAILRIPDPVRRAAMHDELVHDLSLVT